MGSLKFRAQFRFCCIYGKFSGDDKEVAHIDAEDNQNDWVGAANHVTFIVCKIIVQ